MAGEYLFVAWGKTVGSVQRTVPMTKSPNIQASIVMAFGEETFRGFFLWLRN